VNVMCRADFITDAFRRLVVHAEHGDNQCTYWKVTPLFKRSAYVALVPWRYERRSFNSESLHEKTI
jgi:hypothetical protein